MKDMNDVQLKPFRVNFVETYKHSMTIMAEDEDDAQQQAAELWDEGFYKATKFDLTNLEVYADDEEE